ncbi:MAG: hypothetical protein PHN56_01270, partial [Candidatus Nanoarchaeia archaeon]|nr:hypothetical protein [Candidatus Nanoarchaeia archaeon]
MVNSSYLLNNESGLENKIRSAKYDLSDSCISDSCDYSGEFLLNEDNLYVCPDCAVVQGSEFVNYEKKMYDNKETNERKDHETPWRDFGPRTGFRVSDVKYDKDYNENKKKYNTLLKINKSLVNSLERNYHQATPFFNDLCSKLSVPKYISKTAWKIYTNAFEKKLLLGRGIETMLAASLYIAVRNYDFPIFLEELVEKSQSSEKNINKSIAVINKEILPKLGIIFKPISTRCAIFKIGSLLDLPEKIKINAYKILNYSIKKGLKALGKD